MAHTHDLDSFKTSLGSKKTVNETDETSLTKPVLEEIKSNAETENERSFKEGLYNNSDTEKNSPQQK